MGIGNSFEYYRCFIERLQQEPGIRLAAVESLTKGDLDGHTVALRHDIDADLETGLRCARYLSGRAVPGSFYLLHTSHYYGVFEDRLFYRYSGLSKYIDDFVACGVEIGLHTDPLSIYLDHQVDGAQAVVREIRWLRSQGVDVKGTVAHNSTPVYGADNFEIFKGRGFQNRTSYKKEDITIPLQSVSEKELGLEYEANFPEPIARPATQDVAEYLVKPSGDAVRKVEWLSRYLKFNPMFSRGYDISVWLLGQDQWVISDRRSNDDIMWPVTADEVIKYLRSTRQVAKTIVNIHPVYVAED